MSEENVNMEVLEPEFEDEPEHVVETEPVVEPGT